ncbi:hypothetical protein M758_2G032500 [Ceratodon purpureus]|nr:hypothetical protein M758_2G032500 [Ceratodon purpureus]
MTSVATMSAAQIVEGQTTTPTKMGLSKRVYPILSLNPYQGNWTIKVRVTSKSPLRTFKNARGEGNVFNVELTDEDGTQIQATMFKDAADKFYDVLQLDKVYYISKGSLRMANKQYATVKNDYEMTLNANSEVTEAVDEASSFKLPSTTYSFTKISELGQHISAKRFVDVLGVVQSVGPLTTVNRKTNNDEIPKRDVVLLDQSQQTVVLTLWNNTAEKEGAALADIASESPILMAKGLRLSDFQGVSLSSTMNTMVLINPSIPDANDLRAWYEQDGKTASSTPAGASLPGGTNQSRSSFTDRAVLSEITEPSVGEGKPVYLNVRAYISFIKPDQAMWYIACQTCNRKLVEESTSSYWCEGCQKHSETCSRRYIMQAKLLDSSGEAWVSAFNEQAESLLGVSADNLSEMRSQAGEDNQYEKAVRKAMWQPRVYRISAAQTEYMGEKRQRLTVRTVVPVDWVAESKNLLAKMVKA